MDLISASLAIFSHGLFMFVGLELIIGGIKKMQSDSEFERILYSYELLPEFLVGTVSKGLPFIEIGLGTLLLVPLTASIAIIPVAALLLIFAGAMAINLFRGRSYLDCGCGSGSTISWLLVAGNAALTLLLLAAKNAPHIDALLLAGSFVLAAGAHGFREIYSVLQRMAVHTARNSRQGLS